MKPTQVFFRPRDAFWHIFFVAGWADTPAVRNSMPDFYEKMKNKLRTTEQGADTIVWLAISEAAAKRGKSGCFYQDRTPVSEHLPLAMTRAKEQEEQKLMAILDEYYEKFQP